MMQLNWNEWKEDNLPEIDKLFIVYGKIIDTGLYPTYLSPDWIVQWVGIPEYIKNLDGDYVYTGRLDNIHLAHSKDVSLRFYSEVYGFDIEYWLYLDDLILNFK